jgi:hypothetical protein
MQKRNQKKAESEKRYYEDKTYVAGDWVYTKPQPHGLLTARLFS